MGNYLYFETNYSLDHFRISEHFSGGSRISQTLGGGVLLCRSATSGGSRISPRRGRQLPGGAPTYDFAKISQKLDEIERIWTPRGAHGPCAPLRSATGYCTSIVILKFLLSLFSFTVIDKYYNTK